MVGGRSSTTAVMGVAVLGVAASASEEKDRSVSTLGSLPPALAVMTANCPGACSTTMPARRALRTDLVEPTRCSVRDLSSRATISMSLKAASSSALEGLVGSAGPARVDAESEVEALSASPSLPSLSDGPAAASRKVR
ncbi:hypothetical protein DFJ74DRAFT_670588 [Hyaloraphidium curvatum]|nr:hypothetical protein DFJ74DRAFT_670588 [Hyaloraphidium curvatum]